MKNLKIFQRATALFAAGSILLLSGCSSKQTTNTTAAQNKEIPEYCTHLTVYFEDTPITFKECEGYKVFYSSRVDSGLVSYSVTKDDTTVIESGRTSNFNIYSVNHDAVDQIIDEDSVQKTK